ncbi:SDR family NAD(P)-dependent oxidoreductase [Parabacteroides sp. PF5-9]|uniref:SDR family NAD(P)-dependent oxidoreductase n=1 Tax=Parabacteroides sp. PF5-9 TaxID=1742404 RepID=UPI0024755DAC|nr:SDR family NAD(P)-dependent oxidoreductase [Parabacteroides sp. PF5-9]MDH6357272.1 short-subunit dehydrogenase [Parabacteroides sp. PF5-9]
MKKIIIIGATSGIGYEVMKIYRQRGYRLGIAGRRLAELEKIQAESMPGQVEIQQIDITQADAVDRLKQLIDQVGGMDLFLLSSGIGQQNRTLDPLPELQTVETNVAGFTRMVTAVYHYFRKQGKGHLAVISSIAGTKGLGVAPAYSATKRFQNSYMDALAQLSRMERLSITFTDIRPGFVRTALLKSGHYPMLMQPDKVAGRIVKALDRKRRVVVIDWRYRLLVFFWRLIPRWLWERLPVHN